MCFGRGVSVATWVAGMAGCGLLAWSGHLAVAIFLSWVVQMQLVEALLWARQPCSSPAAAAANLRVSAWGAWVNHLEPVALWGALAAFGPRPLPWYSHAVAAAYAAYAVAVTAGLTARCTEPTRASAPHLHWRWNETLRGSYPFAPLYVFFLATVVVLLLTGLPLAEGATLAVLSVGSLGISWALYGRRHAIGAVWCFAAALSPWLLLLLWRKRPGIGRRPRARTSSPP